MEKLETERLILRRWNADDLTSLHALLTDTTASVPAGYRPSSSPEESLVRLGGMISSPEAWALTLRGSDEAVGWIRFRNDDARNIPGSYVLGFVLREDLRRQGYMTEALRAALDEIFSGRDAGIITARCLPDNTASRKVLGACGFSFEGTMQRAVRTGSGLSPVCVYSYDGTAGRDDPELIPKKLASLYEPSEGWLSGMCNGVALLYDELDMVNWAGIYLMRDGALRLGPFGGKPACTVLTLDRGVCAAAAREKRTVVVPDVHAFPGHIACDSASRSEIVIPLMDGDTVLGVLDIDSPVPDRFSGPDRAMLESAAAVFTEMIKQKTEEEK